MLPSNGDGECVPRHRKLSTVTGGLVSDVNDFKDDMAAADDSQTSFFAKVRVAL